MLCGYPTFIVAQVAHGVGARHLILMSLLTFGVVHATVVHSEFETVIPTLFTRVPITETLLFVLILFEIVGFVRWIYIDAESLDHACEFLDLRA